MTSSSVNVPVLSTHNTSMPPKPCIASSCLTTVSFFAIAALPRAKQTVTTIGKSSGTSPTATDRENKKEVIQLPRITPDSTNTTGTSAAIKRSRTYATEVAPPSKRRFGRRRAERPLAQTVCSPTAKTMPSALPLTTAAPIKARLGKSNKEASAQGVFSASFSTMRLSPVSCDWERKKSLV